METCVLCIDENLSTRVHLRAIVQLEMRQRDSYLGLVRDVTTMVLGLLPDLRVSAEEMVTQRVRNSEVLLEVRAKYEVGPKTFDRAKLVRAFPQLGTVLLEHATLCVCVVPYGIVFLIDNGTFVHQQMNSIISYTRDGTLLFARYYIGSFRDVGNGHYVLDGVCLYNPGTGVSTHIAGETIAVMLPCGLAKQAGMLCNMSTGRSISWIGPNWIDDYGEQCHMLGTTASARVTLVEFFT